MLPQGSGVNNMVVSDFKLKYYNVNPIENKNKYFVHEWKDRIAELVKEELLRTNSKDGSHDFGHFERVANLALRLAEKEDADLLVVCAAAFLHDIINIPKNDARRSLGSLNAANRAIELLESINFPEELIGSVCHAIHAHSFSANVPPQTIEAKLLKRSDMMAASGAEGVMRVFYISGKINSEILNSKDPAAEHRDLNDGKYALDHFPVKLFKLANLVNINAGQDLASKLGDYLKDFRSEMIVDQQENNTESARFRIANVFRDAGKKNLALFDDGDPLGKEGDYRGPDPFAENGRKLDPFKYALDSLLNDKDEYIQKFIAQFRYEFNEVYHQGNKILV